MERRAPVPGVPALRLSRSLHLTAFFPRPGRSGGGGRRRGQTAGTSPPPAMMADVRIVIKRRFRVGPAPNQIVEEAAEDIALRRQPSRKLRLPERVERALASDVIPLLENPLDRGALVAAKKEICAYVSDACGDPRLVNSGVQVLVLLETFAVPVIRVPRKIITWSDGARKNIAATAVKTNPCLELELESKAAEKVPVRAAARSVGVIGDRRPKPTEERFKGWLPW